MYTLGHTPYQFFYGYWMLWIRVEGFFFSSRIDVCDIFSSDFNHMCCYGILTWYWYLKLGHNSFLSPLVTFVSLSCRVIPLSFHLLMVIVIFCLSFVGIFWCYTRAYPFLLSWWRCLISSLFESFIGSPRSHTGAYPFFIKVSTSAVASWVSPFCSEFCFKVSPVCLSV